MKDRVKLKLQELVDNEIQKLPELLAVLPPQEHVRAILELLPYIQPKIKPEKDRAENDFWDIDKF